MKKLISAAFLLVFLISNLFAATATVAPIAKVQFMNSAGSGPCSGCKLYSYEPSSTTLKATYTDTAATTANSIPVVMDSAGRANVFLDGCYKLILKTSADVTIWTEDNICEYSTASPTFSQWQDSGLTPTYISATSFSFAGDQTTLYEPGLRLKTVNTGGTVYSTIVSSSYGASITTITVANDSGTLDSGLSDVDYSILAVANHSLPTRPVSAKTSGYTITPSDCGETIISNISSAGTITVPAANTVPSGCEVVTQNTSTYGLTLAGTINGASNPVLMQYNKARLVSNNSSWYADIDAGSAAYNLFSVQTLTTGTTYTPTVGTRAVMVEMTGAGGGASQGSTATAGNASCGGGGGSGGYARKFFTGINLASSYTYSVGSGGTNATGTGNAGGNTTFTGPGSVTVTAFGGAGGLASGLTTSTLTPIIGVGGAGGAVSTNGDINQGGEGGDYCIATYNNGQYAIGGKGGSSMFGGAGMPDYRVAGSFSTGADATGYGAGGGGGITYAATTAVGSTASGGVIYVWEFK